MVCKSQISTGFHIWRRATNLTIAIREAICGPPTFRKRERSPTYWPAPCCRRVMVNSIIFRRREAVLMAVFYAAKYIVFPIYSVVLVVFIYCRDVSGILFWNLRLKSSTFTHCYLLYTQKNCFSRSGSVNLQIYRVSAASPHISQFKHCD